MRKKGQRQRLPPISEPRLRPRDEIEIRQRLRQGTRLRQRLRKRRRR